jgi:hypothetical protein
MHRMYYVDVDHRTRPAGQYTVASNHPASFLLTKVTTVEPAASVLSASVSDFARHDYVSRIDTTHGCNIHEARWRWSAAPRSVHPSLTPAGNSSASVVGAQPAQPELRLSADAQEGVSDLAMSGPAEAATGLGSVRAVTVFDTAFCVTHNRRRTFRFFPPMTQTTWW